MKCKNCGAEFEGRFCSSCGAPSDNPKTFPEISELEKQMSSSNDNKNPKEPFYKKKWFIVIVIVVVIFLIVKIASCGDGKKKKRDDEPVTKQTMKETAWTYEEEPETEEPTTEEPTTEAPTTAAPTTAAPTTAATSSGIRPDFKAAMDSYEQFYDEYIAFMKKYESNPSDFSLLSQYATMMTKATEVSNKFDQWESSDLNDAELQYYLQVQQRVLQKLSAVE